MKKSNRKMSVKEVAAHITMTMPAMIALIAPLFNKYPMFFWGLLNGIGSISAITMIFNTVKF